MDEKDLLLERTASDLLKMENNFQEFAYAVSHNLRGPMSSILGLTMMADAESDEDQLRGLIDMIRTKAVEVDHIIHDLNQIVSLHKGVYDIRQMIDLKELMIDILQGFRSKSKASFDIESSQVYFLTSLETVRSILSQIIDNAVKYSNFVEKPLITVRACDSEDKVRIEVIDNGIGIAPGSLEQVFKPYVRANWEQPGKGLGLYYAKLQVEMIGGSIEMESVPSGGTTVRVSLPKEIQSDEHVVMDSSLGKFTYFPKQSTMFAKWKQNMDVNDFNQFFHIITQFIKRYRVIAWVADIRDSYNDEKKLNKVRERFRSPFESYKVQCLILILDKDDITDPSDPRNLKAIKENYTMPIYFVTSQEEAFSIIETEYSK